MAAISSGVRYIATMGRPSGPGPTTAPARTHVPGISAITRTSSTPHLQSDSVRLLPLTRRRRAGGPVGFSMLLPHALRAQGTYPKGATARPRNKRRTPTAKRWCGPALGLLLAITACGAGGGTETPLEPTPVFDPIGTYKLLSRVALWTTSCEHGGTATAEMVDAVLTILDRGGSRMEYLSVETCRLNGETLGTLTATGSIGASWSLQGDSLLRFDPVGSSSYEAIVAHVVETSTSGSTRRPVGIRWEARTVRRDTTRLVSLPLSRN